MQSNLDAPRIVEERNPRSIEINPLKLNIVLQKEYLIIEPTDPHPILATSSVRGCYAILIYHQKRSAILHWDDNCCREYLNDVFIKNYLLDNPNPLKDTAIHLIGGWVDNVESSGNGEFLRSFFEQSGAILNLDYYQKKKAITMPDEKNPNWHETGFSCVTLDSQTGQVGVSDDFAQLLKEEDGLCRGSLPRFRIWNSHYLDLIHLQKNSQKHSGTPIIHRDSFFQLQDEQAKKLCVAAQKNNIGDLIELIDKGITHIDVSPPMTKGCTALHYACKAEALDAAVLLIRHGANILKKNNNSKSPLDLIPKANSKMIRRLVVEAKVVQQNMQLSVGSLTTCSLFARNYLNLIDEPLAIGMKKISSIFENEAGLKDVEQQLARLVLEERCHINRQLELNVDLEAQAKASPFAGAAGKKG